MSLCSVSIQWVEDHPSCLRMRLGDMQAKPHVRVTKYPLLLKSVLENTQEPQVQQALKGMVRVWFCTNISSADARHFPHTSRLSSCSPLQLSSVKRFLESINDYIRLRGDELALSISAQRLEGYEVEGLNEEIDRVKQIAAVIVYSVFECLFNFSAVGSCLYCSM